MPSSKGTGKTFLSGRLWKMLPPDNDERRASWYVKTPDGKDVFLIVWSWSRKDYDAHTDKRVDCTGDWTGQIFEADEVKINAYGS